MSNPVISVRGIGKKYRLGATIRHDTIRDIIAHRFKSLFRRDHAPSAMPQAHSDDFWALRDVSFDVQQGDVIGIIGSNGAGKSTLLKILSQITEPTEGEIRIRGRVASLLEVGTGFHPELSGRENIYLNGAILGMTRTEIRKKFDEIVAFSEVEKFIDTPVKRYSSGMYVRLAFAVAANLEPEILIIDEVLAVGDASFQKKCIGKMQDVSREGRTVLFVSHNMAAVQRLCQSAFLLRQGTVAFRGEVSNTIDVYLRHGAGTILSWERTTSSQSQAYFSRVCLVDRDGKDISHVTTGTKLNVLLEFVVKNPLPELMLSVGILDAHGDQIFGTRPQDAGQEMPTAPGTYQTTLILPAEILLPKRYGVGAALWLPNIGVLDTIDPLYFSVQETATFANTTTGPPRAGSLVIPCEWETCHRLDQTDGP